jgi:Tol biopolymer transport system component
LSNVIVVDATTGETVAQSNGEVFSFWWSPDSTRIALLQIAGETGESASLQRTVSFQPLAQQSDPSVQWNILNVTDGQSQFYAPFIPNYELAYLANYFDQFYISHQLWSPDSRYLVYSEIMQPRGNPQVTLLDTQDSKTYKLTDGIIGVWSY